jgi:2OG-Fe dioxygenase
VSVPTVSDDSIGKPPGLDHARAALERRGYALTSDQEIGLPVKFRENFVQTYFVEGVIRHDEGDQPADRQRARDVIKYEWRGEDLQLEEYDKITITDRAGIRGPREHSRVWLLADPQAEELIRTFLSLVPPKRRRSRGTFGVNLFRTFSDVVTKPHRDYEEFIFLYVLDRIGEGAESYLYRSSDISLEGEPTAEPLFSQQLNPGEILVFEDEAFKHGATALKSVLGGATQRDVLVCTVDDPKTYLEPASAN